MLIRQDNVLIRQDQVLASLQVILFFFFLLFPKNGSVGRWETKHFMGMALNKVKSRRLFVIPVLLFTTSVL